MSVIEMDKKKFEENISILEGDFNFIGDKPVVLKLSTQWCQPCKRIAPIISELSTEYKDKIDIYSIDVEDMPEVASMFGVQSVPTIVYVSEDGTTHVKTGAYPKQSFIDDFKEYFNI